MRNIFSAAKAAFESSAFRVRSAEKHGRSPIANALRFMRRAYMTMKHGAPLVAVRYIAPDGAQQIVDDPFYGVAIAYALAFPITELVTLPLSQWHRCLFDLRAAEYVTYNTIPTGEFIARCRAAGTRIGTFHSHGEAYLVHQGYSHREAHALVAAHRAMTTVPA